MASFRRRVDRVHRPSRLGYPHRRLWCEDGSNSMNERPRVSVATLLWRWVVGMGLVSWRYLWATTPLYRTQTEQRTPQQPPALPEGLSRQAMQPWESGVGPLYRRLFRVHI